MKLLITGTTGFVGRNLKEYFQTKSHDILTPKRDELNLLDPHGVRTYIEKNDFDTVIHCGVTLSSVEENLKMYFNIERCRASFGRLICVGSGAEYDMNHYHPHMKESFFGRHIPSDIYGFSKYVIAKDIESRHRNIYNLRVFGIYGKYENYMRRFISNNICRVLAGLDISINRNMFFDYLHVDDFCRIAEWFIHHEPTHRSYNICSGTPIDLLSLARIIKRVHGGDSEIKIKETGLNPEYTGDNALFLSECAGFDFTLPEKRIPELYRWYRDSSHIDFDPSIFQ